MEPPDSLTRDQVLLWLNDRIGKQVRVDVTISLGESDGDDGAQLLVYEGELRHWTTKVPPDLLPRASQDKIAGMYAVGSMLLNVSALDSALTHRVQDPPNLVIDEAGHIDQTTKRGLVEALFLEIDERILLTISRPVQ